MRTIGVVTVARSDYGIYVPLLKRIQQDPALGLHLIVSGAHLSAEFGSTVSAIVEDGFAIGDKVEALRASDTPQGIATAIGDAVSAFGRSYGRSRPDVLVVLGDRFEMFAAALAALPFRIPVAHIHGGELTFGAIDDALRHAMTKLSHLHFVATDEYRRRVEQLGEAPWRIVVSGAPALDNLRGMAFRTLAELSAQHGFPASPAPLLVTFHPVTLEYEQVESQTGELLAALDSAGLPVVFTQPNADSGGRRVSEMIDAFVAAHPRAYRVDNFGVVGYFSMMQVAAAMVGNSSSGLVEAPSLGLPVVNVGIRQDGRVRGANVIDTGNSRDEILAGIRAAVQPAFRERLRDRVNPYGRGGASEVIVRHLKDVALDDRLLVKRFHDLDAVGVGLA